jgi:hypothetical protein
MPASDRGGLKAAFTNFNKPDSERAAELKLLGRTIEDEASVAPNGNSAPVSGPVSTSVSPPSSYQVATPSVTPSSGLTPRPLLQREAVRQLSFRCPVSTAAALRRKAAFNQLEQQEIIVAGLKRVLGDLPDPPPGWEG